MDQSFSKHIKDLEQQLLSPEVRTDLKKLDQLLAEDFLEYGSSGKVFGKKECLKPGGVGPRHLKMLDYTVKELSTECVICHFKVWDEERQVETLRTSIWKHNNGQWQMSFHQGTVSNEYQ
ncbi:DUF4440 domain-containing protein [Halalkalibacillus halophilus]|uniref:nuclear transport factor 2 family protein n=1 Tax=Halalkalibacillus halophilus TaxID=392827 RepID=UPI0004115446|nr:DUF4440 domain-containing protein [Halalkalibacillus halophilus]